MSYRRHGVAQTCLWSVFLDGFRAWSSLLPNSICFFPDVHHINRVSPMLTRPGRGTAGWGELEMLLARGSWHEGDPMAFITGRR